jgi:hypothetical protein
MTKVTNIRSGIMLFELTKTTLPNLYFHPLPKKTLWLPKAMKPKLWINYFMMVVSLPNITNMWISSK